MKENEATITLRPRQPLQPLHHELQTSFTLSTPLGRMQFQPASLSTAFLVHVRPPSLSSNADTNVSAVYTTDCRAGVYHRLRDRRTLWIDLWCDVRDA